MKNVMILLGFLSLGFAAALAQQSEPVAHRPRANRDDQGRLEGRKCGKPDPGQRQVSGEPHPLRLPSRSKRSQSLEAHEQKRFCRKRNREPRVHPAEHTGHRGPGRRLAAA